MGDCVTCDCQQTGESAGETDNEWPEEHW